MISPSQDRGTRRVGGVVGYLYRAQRARQRSYYRIHILKLLHYMYIERYSYYIIEAFNAWWISPEHNLASICISIICLCLLSTLSFPFQPSALLIWLPIVSLRMFLTHWSWMGFSCVIGRYMCTYVLWRSCQLSRNKLAMQSHPTFPLITALCNSSKCLLIRLLIIRSEECVCINICNIWHSG